MLFNVPKNHAFTLAELLIALAILGVIATFTIPKVLVNSQNQRYNAIAKEAMATVSQAYQQYQLNKTSSASTTFADMTPYLNYAFVETAGKTYDAQPGNGFTTCTTSQCLRLHNGATLVFWDQNNFNGTASTNAIVVCLDPDSAQVTANTMTPGKSIAFFLYFNGAITTYAQPRVNTVVNNQFNSNPAGLSYPTPNPVKDPDWFSWN